MPVALLNPSDAKQLRKLNNEAMSALQRQRAAERNLRTCVRQLRTKGYSWAAIAKVVGGTRQAAQQRYGETTAPK